MNNHNYLHQDKEAIAKIKRMLESKQEAQILVALQLIEGGGLPLALITHLYVLVYFFDTEEMIPQQARKLLQKIDDPALIHFLQHYPYGPSIDWYSREIHQHIANFLSEAKAVKVLDTFALANLLLKFTGYSALFCLKHQTAPVIEILQSLHAHDEYTMDFAGFALAQLPEEVGNFTEIRCLDISFNAFTEVPDSLENLKNLEEITLAGTPLSAKAMGKLEHFFPKPMAEHYASLAYDVFDKKDYTQAIEYIDKCLTLVPENPSYLNSQGINFICIKDYNQALAYFEQGMKVGLPHATGFYNKACTYAQKGDKKQMLHFLAETFSLDTNFKSTACADADFEAYWKDLDFLALVREDA